MICRRISEDLNKIEHNQKTGDFLSGFLSAKIFYAYWYPVRVRESVHCAGDMLVMRGLAFNLCIGGKEHDSNEDDKSPF